jgi:hypothetical protein
VMLMFDDDDDDGGGGGSDDALPFLHSTLRWIHNRRKVVALLATSVS